MIYPFEFSAKGNRTLGVINFHVAFEEGLKGRVLVGSLLSKNELYIRVLLIF